MLNIDEKGMCFWVFKYWPFSIELFCLFACSLLRGTLWWSRS
jgi:hypothetical protein